MSTVYICLYTTFSYISSPGYTRGVSVTGTATAASKKRLFSVTTAPSVTLSPHRAAEPQFGEDGSVLVTAKNHRAAS